MLVIKIVKEKMSNKPVSGILFLTEIDQLSACHLSGLSITAQL